MTIDNSTEQLRQYSAAKLRAAEQREHERLHAPSSLDYLVDGIIIVGQFHTKIKALLSKQKRR